MTTLYNTIQTRIIQYNTTQEWHSVEHIHPPRPIPIVEQTSSITQPGYFILGEQICNTQILLLTVTNGRTMMITNSRQ